MADHDTPRGRFIRDLERARTQYDDDPQVGSAAMLMAVVFHLETLGASERLIKPFTNLAMSIGDARNGIQNEHTAVAEGRGGHRTRLQERIDKSWAAAIVTMFLKAKDSLEPSLSRVCRALGGTLETKQLKDYRKRLTRRDERLPPEAQRNYDDFMGNARQTVTRLRKEKNMEQRAAWRAVAEASLSQLKRISHPLPSTKVD